LFLCNEHFNVQTSTTFPPTELFFIILFHYDQSVSSSLTNSDFYQDWESEFEIFPVVDYNLAALWIVVICVFGIKYLQMWIYQNNRKLIIPLKSTGQQFVSYWHDRENVNLNSTITKFYLKFHCIFNSTGMQREIHWDEYHWGLTCVLLEYWTRQFLGREVAKLLHVVA
jgi:hypothetical protein